MEEACLPKRMKMEIGSSKIEPILGDEFTAPVVLVEMYACQVKNKKETSKILRFLSSRFPFEKYPHLKRVRSDTKNSGDMHILICEKADNQETESLEKDLAVFDLGPLRVLKVPSKPPLTRHQFEDACQYWPVNFHENKSITKMMNGSNFTPDDILQMEAHMMEAMTLAHKAKMKGQQPIGALMVDPASNTVIARSHDLRQGDHPLHHAAMVCIDLVAKSQGGGMWKYTDDTDLYAVEPDNTKDSTSCLPYLCTGYDLYITQEPCIMCTMALLHSRISRVFYGSSTSEGALGSQYKLHVTEGLNHHFQAFRGLLKDQCDKLYDGT